MDYNNDARALILGLLSRCPFKNVDPGCPLLAARSRNVPEMKQLAFHRLSDGQIERILTHHERCECIRDNPLSRKTMKPLKSEFCG